MYRNSLSGSLVLLRDAELKNAVIILCFDLVKVSSLWHADSAPDILTAALHPVIPTQYRLLLEAYGIKPL